MARNAPFGRRAGARVRGEASAGAGAHGARCWAGRGGSAQQPRQPHAELAEEPEPRAPGGRSARRPAVREGRGEPRGGESVSGCHRCSHRPCRPSPPPAPLGGIKGGKEAGSAAAAAVPERGPALRGGTGRTPCGRAGSRCARGAARPRGRLPGPGPVPAAGRKARGGCGIPGREVALAGWCIPFPRSLGTNPTFLLPLPSQPQPKGSKGLRSASKQLSLLLRARSRNSSL